MIANKQIKLIVVLAVSVLIGTCLLFQFGKRIERAAEGVQRENFGGKFWGLALKFIGTYYPVKGVK